MPTTAAPDLVLDLPGASATDVVAASPSFSKRILDFGFIAGVALAALCLLLSALYLHQFLTATNEGVGALLSREVTTSEQRQLVTMGISARLVMARLGLRSCGVFVGLAFGFLGFSLFLIGVRGELDARAEHGSTRVTLLRLSPGVFVIVCATVLIALCVSLSTPFEFTQTTAAKAAEDAPSAGTDSVAKPEPQSLIGKDNQH